MMRIANGEFRLVTHPQTPTRLVLALTLLFQIQKTSATLRASTPPPKLPAKQRTVDRENEVITATKITPGCTDDGDMLGEVISSHKQNTQSKLETVVADSRYGKIDNFLMCHDQGVKAHIAPIEETQRGSGRQKGIFPKEAFTYDRSTDTFTCPAGRILKRRKLYKNRRHYEYTASAKTCNQCALKKQCTRSKSGRTLKRHVRQDELNTMLKAAKSQHAKKDLKDRQHISERSFARSKRYGYQRARWRGLWRMEIQDFLIAAVQNITVLISQPKHHMSKSNIQRVPKGNRLINRPKSVFKELSKLVMSAIKRQILSWKRQQQVPVSTAFI